MDHCIQKLPGEGESGGCDPSSKLDYWGPGEESWDQHVLESHFSPISLCHPKEPGGSLELDSQWESETSLQSQSSGCMAAPFWGETDQLVTFYRSRVLQRGTGKLERVVWCGEGGCEVQREMGEQESPLDSPTCYLCIINACRWLFQGTPMSTPKLTSLTT